MSGHSPAFLRQEALKQQLHAYRIDCGDTEGITNGAIRLLNPGPAPEFPPGGKSE
jgi:hypothetical protein